MLMRIVQTLAVRGRLYTTDAKSFYGSHNKHQTRLVPWTFRVDAANNEAVKRMQSAQLWLEDIAPAAEVIPWLKSPHKRILVASPPVTWETMSGAQRGACKGIVIYEGWAKDGDSATELLQSGEVEIHPCHHHDACGPMSGCISPSFPLWVVRNKAFNTVTYSRPADLSQQFGDFKHIEDIQWWTEKVAPNLRKGLLKLGGLDLNFLINLAQDLGDESHNRNDGLTLGLVNSLAIGMIKAGVPNGQILPILEWFHPSQWKTGSGVRACLGLAMASAKGVLKPIEGLKHSSIISIMARNGAEFGLRVAGLGDRWFTAPAPIPTGKFFAPYTQEDAGGDMGDSAITETNGWGSFILKNSPSFLAMLPVNLEQSERITADNEALVIAENPLFPVPALGFRGSPCGIDLRRIIESGETPWINTGIAHKDEGHRVIGRGIVRAPLEAFQEAWEAFQKVENEQH